MKDYQTAVMFEQACQVRRLLEYVGKEPTKEDNFYIHQLGRQLDEIVITDIERWWQKIMSNV